MLRSIIISLLLLNCVAEVASQEIAPGNIPNQVQKAMQRRGYGMFIHFGPNTFADVEWSDGSIPVSQYNPTRLDPGRMGPCGPGRGLPLCAAYNQTS